MSKREWHKWEMFDSHNGGTIAIGWLGDEDAARAFAIAKANSSGRCITIYRQHYMNQGEDVIRPVQTCLVCQN